MRRTLAVIAFAGAAALSASAAHAQNLLVNGTLDTTYQQEITPGFFLPKPANWVNEGSRTISGPYEDEMSSEPWAGQAPTPVTTEGEGGTDQGVFFKAFSGSAANGAATGHLYQDVPATPGVAYILRGWAGAEANLMVTGAEIALEFVNAGGSVISGGQVVDLLPTLFVDNDESFDYKQYTATGTAPAEAVSVRARASFFGGLANPAGGGQAFVVDDFELEVVPEPSALALAGLAFAFLARRRRG